jgi:hypothetical protein
MCGLVKSPCVWKPNSFDSTLPLLWVFGEGQEIWLGGWSRHRLYYLVKVDQ